MLIVATRVMAGVGFVAIVENEGERLRNCLESIRGLAESVVYLDSGLSDGSVELGRSLTSPAAIHRARLSGAVQESRRALIRGLFIPVSTAVLYLMFGSRALIVYRFGRWRYGLRPALSRKFFSLLYKLAFKAVQIARGIELTCKAAIGNKFVIDHIGGIIVSGYAKFEDNCRICNGVVVGLRQMDDPRVPVIGNDVNIGAGAKILGPIPIGNNVAIGANAVVLRVVSASWVAVGVPAVNRRRRDCS